MSGDSFGPGWRARPRCTEGSAETRAGDEQWVPAAGAMASVICAPLDASSCGTASMSRASKAGKADLSVGASYNTMPASFTVVFILIGNRICKIIIYHEWNAPLQNFYIALWEGFCMTDNSEELKKGTTTLGITCKEGVVMGTERRATMGTLIAHKTTQKLFKIDEHLALCVAGLVGDAQVLARYLTAEVELYRLKQNSEMSVKAAATLLSNILAGRRFYPYYVQLLLGGADKDGGSVYSLDAAGGSIPDKYVTGGSGSPYVYGVLEDHYKDEMSANEATDLAIRALTAAMKRDCASGDGIDIAVITAKGFKVLTDEDIKKRKNKMGLD